jgi:hypothetical protein
MESNNWKTTQGLPLIAETKVGKVQVAHLVLQFSRLGCSIKVAYDACEPRL